MQRLMLAGLIGCLLAPCALAADDDVVMKAMLDEMLRSMEALRLEELERPYFISYTVEESTTTRASASFGSLVSSRVDRQRWLTVEVRVGSYDLDNTNFLTLPDFGGGSMLRGFGGQTSLPLEDDYQEIRRQIWLATDGAYKDALENLSRKKAALQNKTRSEEIPDFSREEPATVTTETPPVEVDTSRAEALVRDLSRLFQEMENIFTSKVEVRAKTSRTRFLNSEGSTFTRVLHSAGLTATAATQAVDGLALSDFVSAYGRNMEDLPGREELLAAVREMGARLERLREAPLLELYNGPVLFEGQAAAELVSQVLAPGLLAVRKPVTGDPRMAGLLAMSQGQSLEDKIGARILPRFLGIEDDPTLEAHDVHPFVGGYTVDDQGVPAAPTNLVERGILKTLLSDRTPIQGIEKSTGNRRGGSVMPSNVVVSATDGMTSDELKEELLLLVQDREAEFGILVRRMGNPKIQGSSDPMAMFISMSTGGDGSKAEGLIEAYKVYPDGREELLRNVEISGISAASFKDIVAASDAAEIYTSPFKGGSVVPNFMFSLDSAAGLGPLVSWVVPSLLFEDLTLKKPAGEVPNPPVADHPFFDRPTGSSSR
jgi:predicted Zn-dependent protease